MSLRVWTEELEELRRKYRLEHSSIVFGNFHDLVSERHSYTCGKMQDMHVLSPYQVWGMNSPRHPAQTHPPPICLATEP